MAHLTREQILARKRGRDVVELHDGATVEVKGISRREAAEVAEVPEGEMRDAVMIAAGMTEPVLSVDDVMEMFVDGKNGDVLLITGKIMELSGMAPGQAKDATKSVPG
jgi:hypothetical protein